MLFHSEHVTIMDTPQARDQRTLGENRNRETMFPSLIERDKETAEFCWAGSIYLYFHVVERCDLVAP